MAQNDSQNRRFNDLCDSCKNLPTCVYIKNGKRPVLYCEEFEIHEVQQVKDDTHQVDSNAEEESPVFTGLCKNCDNRFTCMNAKPDRIIWHCEDYI